MENKPVRTSFMEAKDERVGPRVEEYEKYKLQTRGEYEELMTEFEFRCQRAAMMNYHEAAGFDKIVYRMEIMAALLGIISLTTLGTWLLQQHSDFSFSNINRLGGLGIVGMAAAFVLEFLSKGSTRVIPSFSRRGEAHINAGAAWQALAQKTRSYRIQLDNPNLDVPTYAEWYINIVTERQKLCSQVCIPESTYKKYNDPNKVFRLLKERRHLFAQFLKLEETDPDGFIDRKHTHLIGKKMA